MTELVQRIYEYRTYSIRNEDVTSMVFNSIFFSFEPNEIIGYTTRALCTMKKKKLHNYSKRKSCNTKLYRVLFKNSLITNR